MIMGTQGATGAKQIFLGSNTVFTIRKVKTPILVIPSNYHFVPIKKIIFPSDLQDSYKKEEIQTIIEMATLFGAQTTLLTIGEVFELTQNQKDNKEMLYDHLRNVSFKQVQVEGKKLSKAILDYIDYNDVDLLTMINRDHSFFERLLIRQPVDQIGFHIHIPFLVIHDNIEVEA